MPEVVVSHQSSVGRVPPANPQSPIPDPQSDWFPLDHAARLTGLPLRTLRHRAATVWQARGRARLAPPPGGKGRPTWHIHESADPRLSRCPNRETRNERQREALLAKYPADHVELAYRKFHWLMQWRKRCARPRLAGQTELSIARQICTDAQSEPRPSGSSSPSSFIPHPSSFIPHPSSFIPHPSSLSLRMSPRSLQLWWAAYNELDETGTIAGIEALVPRYAGPGRPTRSPDAIAYYYSLYHTQGGQTVRTCHEATCEMADREGWDWPRSYAATVRWLERHDDVAESCLHRAGPAKYSQRYMEHLEIDKSVLQPGELYESDHSQCDFWCTHDGVQFRPWFTSILDCRSRLIVGWHLGTAPHQDAILSAMRMAFRDRAIPERFHMDQGRDFTSRLITGFTKRDHRRLRRELGPDWRDILREQYDVLWMGVLGELGVEIVLAIPYQPWSKGQTETSFRFLHDRFDRSFATYCGRDTAHRPECLEVIRRGYSRAEAKTLQDRYGSEWKLHAVCKLVNDSDIPTLDTARKELTDEIELYHHREHRGQAMDGRTPAAVWQTATRLRRAHETELLALLQARGVYRVGANGVRFKIGADTRGYGAASAALRRYKGRDVYVTLDPDDCSFCVAYTADRTHCIGRLESNDRIPANTGVDELREAIRDINRRRKVMRTAAAEAPARMRSASQELRARRARKVAALRATGTDDATANQADIAVVRTGFEAASIPARSAVETAIEPPGDARRRLLDFVKEEAPTEPRPASAWSRLKAISREGQGDG